jgi:hypothetical protein
LSNLCSIQWLHNAEVNEVTTSQQTYRAAVAEVRALREADLAEEQSVLTQAAERRRCVEALVATIQDLPFEAAVEYMMRALVGAEKLHP